MQTANSAERKLKCFCHMLAYNGCRLLEALELIPRRVNITEDSKSITIVFFEKIWQIKKMNWRYSYG